MKELLEIKKYYGTLVAKRSKVPLINHITEGLRVLTWIRSSIWAQRAYCLHPLVQKDEDLKKNFLSLDGFDPRVLTLTMEYRSVANDYLSNTPLKRTEDIRLSPLGDVNDMLIADKVQNYKDFLKYHAGKHERSEELDRYFKQWLERLGVTAAQFDEYKRLLNDE